MTRIGHSLVISGEIECAEERVLVEGQVKGAITATERIELGSKCRVEGSLSANAVVMWDGARFDGGIDMRQRTIAAKMAHYRAENGTAAAPTR